MAPRQPSLPPFPPSPAVSTPRCLANTMMMHAQACARVSALTTSRTNPLQVHVKAASAARSPAAAVARPRLFQAAFRPRNVRGAVQGRRALRVHATASDASASSEYAALGDLSVISVSSGEEVALTSLWGSQSEKVVVAFLTQFGDFDSFELCQRLNGKLEKLQTAGVKVVCVGIGSLDSAKLFCDLTKFPADMVYASTTAAPYDALGFAPGFARPAPPALAAPKWYNKPWLVEQAEKINLHPYWKLVIMCAGVGSPGTLQEVFRGYLGDKEAPPAFERYPGVLPKFMEPLFKVVGEGFQRPFELATVRLINMTNILVRWEKIVPEDKELILQRGGSFVFKGKEVVYRHDDPGILRYADVEKLTQAALAD